MNTAAMTKTQKAAYWDRVQKELPTIAEWIQHTTKIFGKPHSIEVDFPDLTKEQRKQTRGGLVLRGGG